MSGKNLDDELIRSLHKLQKKSSKLVRSTLYDAPEQPDIKIRSWKMSEHHYYKVPSPFPTLARGLFTTWVPGDQNRGEEGEGTGSYRIVARGYDKFFNIGEVPWTTWESISKYTRPPYTLTVKSNGCIIFIAALSSTKLLITSKHSIGSIEGQKMSHSQTGDRWLDKHLASVGRQRSELAKVLWDNRWTAVAELCDDSFEEHVLPYSSEQTGLHLHGINRSSANFETLPSSASEGASVQTLAQEWGFIPTKSFELYSAQEVKEFTDSCALTGSWNEVPLEGFVIRAVMLGTLPTERDPNADTERPSSQRSANYRIEAPPYPPDSPFFFKVKFDEPYMMYRDWREITKSYLSAFTKDGFAALAKAKPSKHRLKRPETRVYDYWVRKAIIDTPELFSGYQHNRGIVKARQHFLDWMASSEGTERLAREKGETLQESTPHCQPIDLTERKTIIVPIAIPGCGKTSIAVALAHIFGFAHTQSDDVVPKGKKTKTARIFEDNVRGLLQSGKYNVVIADKNNHLSQHRSALRDLLPNGSPSVRLIALHWPVSSLPNTELHRICADRIRERGDNHQTLRATREPNSSHEDILWKFINTTEDLTENEVDEIIELDVREDIEASLRRIVSALCKLLQLQTPSEESIRKAVQISNEYAVPTESKRAMSGTITNLRRTGSKQRGVPRYFGIVPLPGSSWRLEEVVNATLAELESESRLEQLHGFWRKMTSEGRLTQQPHITLVHQASLQANTEDIRRFWEVCITSEGSLQIGFRLSHLVYNGRILAIALDDHSLSNTDSTQPSLVLDAIPSSVLNRLHITLGTSGPHVKPVEAGELVLKWRNQRLDPKDGGAVLLKSKPLLKGNLEGLWS